MIANDTLQNDKKLPLKVWNWLILILLSFLPIFNLIFLRGWRATVVRKMGRRNEALFPDLKKGQNLKFLFSEIINVPLYFFRGATLWFITLVYFLPLYFIMLMFGLDIFTILYEMIVWTFKSVFSSNTETFRSIIDRQVESMTVGGIIFIIYYFAQWAFYRAGMIRYSITGNVNSFFQFGTNLKYIKKHSKGFIKACTFATIVEIIFFNAGLLFCTLIPFGRLIKALALLPIVYWSTAFFYGTLATQMDVEKNDEIIKKSKS